VETVQGDSLLHGDEVKITPTKAQTQKAGYVKTYLLPKM